MRRSVWWVMAVVGLVGVASGGRGQSPEPGEAGRSGGRALGGVGAQLVDAGLTRVALGWVGRAGQGAALAAAVRGGVLSAWEDAIGERFRFVGPLGLTEAGMALAAELRKARLYGLMGPAWEAPAVPGVNGIHDSQEARNFEQLKGAWEEGRDPEMDRVRAEAGVPAVMPVGPALSVEARVGAEVRMLEGLLKWVVEAPAQPRTEAVLMEPEFGSYVSPDTVWRRVGDGAVSDAARARFVEGVRAAEGVDFGGWLRSKLPSHPQFGALVTAAERYAGLCARGGWATLKVPANERAAREEGAVRALEERLKAEGLYAGAPSGVWSEDVATAVATYREERQLKDKGGYDADLVASLNVPCDERLQTLILNIRRWRFSAWNQEPESVQVNLPAQMLRYYRGGALAVKQRTVVGSDRSYFNKTMAKRHWRNATPILSDVIETVVVNPEWSVPGRIAREELEPEFEKDPEAMERRGFRMRTSANGTKTYVQGSGAGNALGRVKILFPNDESVYLHDTPGRAAFKASKRALSHGCVRLEDAVGLAEALLMSDREQAGEVWPAGRVRGIIASTTKTWSFQLLKGIPVFLEYYTASVDEEGHVWFHPDIYGYDAETRAAGAL